MTTNSPCKPWCDEHNDAARECLTLRCLYSRGEEPAAQFKALGGFPDQVDTIFIELSYIPEEEDRPEMVLRFRDITNGQDSATLSATIAGLKELHSNLGGIIHELEQA